MKNEKSSSNNINALVKAIIKRLKLKTIPDRKKIAEYYFPTSMLVIGVSAPDIKTICRDFSLITRDTKPGKIIELAGELVKSDVFECRIVAYELLSRRKDAMALLKLKDVEGLGNGNDNWATVDAFSVIISGPCWREGRISDYAIRRWARSPDRWWRRTAVVSTVALNLKSRGGTGDFKRTLDICRLVVADYSDMVAKGLSWALRELSKRDPAVVSDFIETHRSVLASRVLREVTRKIVTGTKSGK
jgi:3-methyladenine DNA glycosylase AlkD